LGYDRRKQHELQNSIDRYCFHFEQHRGSGSPDYPHFEKVAEKPEQWRLQRAGDFGDGTICGVSLLGD
jgi:hypothetical protein